MSTVFGAGRGRILYILIKWRKVQEVTWILETYRTFGLLNFKITLRKNILKCIYLLFR